MNRIHHINVYHYTTVDKWAQMVYYNSGRRKHIGPYDKIPATVQKFIDEHGSLQLIEENEHLKIYKLS